MLPMALAEIFLNAVLIFFFFHNICPRYSSFSALKIFKDFLQMIIITMIIITFINIFLEKYAPPRIILPTRNMSPQVKWLPWEMSPPEKFIWLKNLFPQQYSRVHAREMHAFAWNRCWDKFPIVKFQPYVCAHLLKCDCTLISASIASKRLLFAGV